MKTERLDRLLYPEYPDHWDDHLFRDRVLALLDAHPAWSVLELGAGAGIVREMDFREWGGRICGVDPDPRVTANPYLDEAKLGYGESIPYGDHEFDAVFCNNVMEHLTDPAAVLKEVERVLKPGGWFLFKTPNKHHYVPLIAALTPHAFHEWVNRKRGRKEVDTFPTHYRGNDERSIRRLARETGLRVEWIELVEGRPEYLRFSTVTYALGWLYERAVNRIPGLQRFRVVLVAALRKPVGT